MVNHASRSLNSVGAVDRGETAAVDEVASGITKGLPHDGRVRESAHVKSMRTFGHPKIFLLAGVQRTLASPERSREMETLSFPMYVRSRLGCRI